MKFRIRRTHPEHAKTVWVEVEAESPEAAVMDDFINDTCGAEYVPDVDKPGSRVVFATYEVDGHGHRVARVYRSGITRKGGVRRPGWPPSLEDIARQLGWKRDPTELIESGWMLEEEEGQR